MPENEYTLVCDFVGGPVGYRLKQAGGFKQALPKAAGLKPGFFPKIVDATAGLGRDSFLLASLGVSVTMIERNEIIYRILKEGMDKARNEGGIYTDIIDRMTLISGDAMELLPKLEPDIIIVDPMHPPRTKSALVKKEMRAIRNIVGTDPDAGELMKIALNTAKKRVVLKWPLRAAPMEGIKSPSHQITGKSTRYDVFIRT